MGPQPHQPTLLRQILPSLSPATLACAAHQPFRVSSPSMRIARRLMAWGATAEERSLEQLLSHASYYERTLHNAVLGSQRGVLPGEMLYMMPMGAGVSKAGIPNAPQGHHWSDAEHHFWCCQVSAIVRKGG